MLLTKLNIPTPGRNLVKRPPLFGKLNEGLSHKLTLVTAPAGYGKTTLVSDWIVQYKIPTAWYSLDKGDNDPVDFLRYTISGIQNIDNAFGLNALKLLKSSGKISPDSIVSLLINEILTIDQNFLLVFDDFHLIDNQDIFGLVSHFLKHIPGNIHIVILTRSDPPIPVARLRSQQQLVELRSSDLSFSVNDIYTLFSKKLKRTLSMEDVSSLETKTEGWISGLLLTALSMEGREDISGFIQGLSGDNRYIMDYLLEEVLKIQTDNIKEFLVQTSVLKQISAPLCNAVLHRDDSQLILERLEKNNMFIFPLDTERHWYRYHHLFADLLKQRLSLKDKAVVSKLHNEACNWFEQNYMYELAIEHALEINNYGKCIQLLGKIVESLWENGQHSTIMRYGDILPDETINKSPEFGLHYAWILISAGQTRKAAPLLENAEKTARKIIHGAGSSVEDIQYYKKLLGKISVAFALLYSHETHSERIFEPCKTAMENLSEDDPLWLGWLWFSYGIAYFSCGDLLKSFEAFENAFNYGKQSGNIYLISTIVLRMSDNEQQLGHYNSAYEKCTGFLRLMKTKGYVEITRTDWSYAGLYAILGSTQQMWADTEKAYENVKIAYNLSKKSGDIMLETSVLMLYSIVLHDLGDDLGSEKKIEEAEGLCKGNNLSPYLLFALIAWKLFRFIASDQVEKAYSLLKEYNIGSGIEISHANETVFMVYARFLLARGDVVEAETVLSELYTIINTGKRIERLIDLKISYAIYYRLTEKREKARESLIEALELAAPENLVMFFIHSTGYIHDLLDEIVNIGFTSKTRVPKPFINKLKAALERKERFRKIRKEGDLSARELDTLRLIAEDHSNQEIADKLFISLNTVKTHVRNILLKLEVDKRRQAVTKAKELGII
jgi:LuxR family transcriptional regulator, maltose regulon positive regulatory protein